MGEGSKNAETIVCVAFGASWTSRVIPHFEALSGSRTRTVFWRCIGGLLGALRGLWDFQRPRTGGQEIQKRVNWPGDLKR